MLNDVELQREMIDAVREGVKEAFAEALQLMTVRSPTGRESLLQAVCDGVESAIEDNISQLNITVKGPTDVA